MTHTDIQQIYEQSGLSKRAFAAEIGVSDTAVRGWLEGKPISSENEERLRDFSAKLAAGLTPPARDQSGTSSALALVPTAARYHEPTPIPRSGGVISTADRVTFIGRTGMGKTWLMQEMIGDIPCVLLDSKRLRTLGAMPILPTFDAAQPQQILRLPEGIIGTKGELPAWDAQIGAVIRAGNRLLIFDDFSGINPDYHPRNAVGNALKLGREHNVGVWSLVQGPRNIPRDVLNMADHLLVFSITDPDDIQYLARRIGWQAAEHIPQEKHAGLYFRVEGGGWSYKDYDASRRIRQGAEHAQSRAEAPPALPPAEPPRLTAHITEPPAAATPPQTPDLYSLITLKTTPSSIAAHLHVSEGEVFRRVTEWHGNTAEGIAWLAAFAGQSHSNGAQSGEKHLLSPAAIAKIRRNGYEEGKRDGQKDAAAAVRQIAATSAAPPVRSRPLMPFERRLLGKQGRSPATHSAQHSAGPPLTHVGKLSEYSG